MTTRAEQWKQAVKTKPRDFIASYVRASVSDQGTCLLTIEHKLDLTMLHANLDAYQAGRLAKWLTENFS